MNYHEKIQLKTLSFLVGKGGTVTAEEVSQAIKVHLPTFYPSERLIDIIEPNKYPVKYIITDHGRQVYYYLKDKKRDECITKLILIVTAIAAIIAAIPVIKSWLNKSN